MKKKNYISVYVAMSRGECDPCGGTERLKAENIDKAIALVKELQLDEIHSQLHEEFDGDAQEIEDNWECATEFFEATGNIQDGVGWVEAGEEGMYLVVEEGNKWYEQLLSTDRWNDQTWKEFDELIASAEEPLM